VRGIAGRNEKLDYRLRLSADEADLLILLEAELAYDERRTMALLFINNRHAGAVQVEHVTMIAGRLIGPSSKRISQTITKMADPAVFQGCRACENPEAEC
jgi:hypothetical protein